MTDTQARRRALLSLLDQYPLERDLYLHDGRREISPRDEFADKIEALFMSESTASITTPEGQRDYYRDLSAMLTSENKRLARDLAEYEAYDALPSLFQQVMTASERYVTRFGGKLSLEGATKKMHEEWNELHQEIKMAAMDAELVSEGGGVDEGIAKELLAKEAIYLLVTIGGVLAALRTPIAMTVDAAHGTLDKLDGRTEADYCWDEKSKTVIKRSKLESAS